MSKIPAPNKHHQSVVYSTSVVKQDLSKYSVDQQQQIKNASSANNIIQVQQTPSNSTTYEIEKRRGLAAVLPSEVHRRFSPSSLRMGGAGTPNYAEGGDAVTPKYEGTNRKYIKHVNDNSSSIVQKMKNAARSDMANGNAINNTVENNGKDSHPFYTSQISNGIGSGSIYISTTDSSGSADDAVFFNKSNKSMPPQNSSSNKLHMNANESASNERAFSSQTFTRRENDGSNTNVNEFGHFGRVNNLINNNVQNAEVEGLRRVHDDGLTMTRPDTSSSFEFRHRAAATNLPPSFENIHHQAVVVDAARPAPPITAKKQQVAPPTTLNNSSLPPVVPPTRIRPTLSMQHIQRKQQNQRVDSAHNNIVSAVTNASGGSELSSAGAAVHNNNEEDFNDTQQFQRAYSIGTNSSQKSSTRNPVRHARGFGSTASSTTGNAAGHSNNDDNQTVPVYSGMSSDSEGHYDVPDVYGGGYKQTNRNHDVDVNRVKSFKQQQRQQPIYSQNYLVSENAVSIIQTMFHLCGLPMDFATARMTAEALERGDAVADIFSFLQQLR